jgi:hypothetical protein
MGFVKTRGEDARSMQFNLPNGFLSFTTTDGKKKTGSVSTILPSSSPHLARSVIKSARGMKTSY